jgi:glutamine cyclotransferase
MNSLSDVMTLKQMVEVLDRSESEEVDLGLIQEVIKALPTKVDGCAQYLDSLDDEITRAKDYSKKFSDLAKQIEARKERFEGYLKHSIESNGFEKLTGDAFQMTIKKNPASVVVKREVDAIDSLNYPGFVTSKVTFSWDKKALKEGIEAGDKVALELAELVQKTSLKVGIKK